MLCQLQVNSKVNHIYIYICLYTSTFFRFFSLIDHYRVLVEFPSLYSRSFLVICFIYSSVFINSNLPIYLSPFPSVTTSFNMILKNELHLCSQRHFIIIYLLLLNNNCFTFKINHFLNTKQLHSRCLCGSQQTGKFLKRWEYQTT